MVVTQGEVWWADLPDPIGSGPGFRRPVVIVQADAFNWSRLATVVCVPLTGNTRWARAPGNTLLDPQFTGLSKESVAMGCQILTIDRSLLTERTAKLPNQQLEAVLSGIALVLGRALAP